MTNTKGTRWDWSLDPNDEPLARIRPHAHTPLGKYYQQGKAEELTEVSSGDEAVDEAWRRIGKAIDDLGSKKPIFRTKGEKYEDPE